MISAVDRQTNRDALNDEQRARLEALGPVQGNAFGRGRDPYGGLSAFLNDRKNTFNGGLSTFGRGRGAPTFDTRFNELITAAEAQRAEEKKAEKETADLHAWFDTNYEGGWDAARRFQQAHKQHGWKHVGRQIEVGAARVVVPVTAVAAGITSIFTFGVGGIAVTELGAGIARVAGAGEARNEGESGHAAKQAGRKLANRTRLWGGLGATVGAAGGAVAGTQITGTAAQVAAGAGAADTIGHQIDHIVDPPGGTTSGGGVTPISIPLPGGSGGSNGGARPAPPPSTAPAPMSSSALIALGAAALIATLST